MKKSMEKKKKSMEKKKSIYGEEEECDWMSYLGEDLGGFFFF